LTTLMQNGSSPLPPGLVDSVMPRLMRSLMTSKETSILQVNIYASHLTGILLTYNQVRFRDSQIHGWIW